MKLVFVGITCALSSLSAVGCGGGGVDDGAPGAAAQDLSGALAPTHHDAGTDAGRDAGGDAGAPACSASGPVAIATHLARPNGIATDGVNVYWSELGTTGALAGTVSAVPVEGGRITVLASDQAAPTRVVVDATNVYWADLGVGGPTGSIETVSKLGGFPVPLALGLEDPNDLAVDDFTNVYYVAGNAVMTVNKLGGLSAPLAFGLAPWTIAVDTFGVYYGDATPLGGAQTVNVVSKIGGLPRVLATKQGPAALAQDATTLYWVNFWGGTIVSEPKVGGTVTELATGSGGFGAIAVDDTKVYTTQGGAIASVPKGGGAATVLATTTTLPQGIAVDATAVYWTEEGTYSASGGYNQDGAVFRLCK